jgi:hypothetical protein
MFKQNEKTCLRFLFAKFNVYGLVICIVILPHFR